MVGLRKKKKKKKKPTVLRSEKRKQLTLDGEAVKSPQEAKTWRMSDTCPAFPTTLLRTDHTEDHFYTLRKKGSSRMAYVLLRTICF